jgi:hypothetical protein
MDFDTCTTLTTSNTTAVLLPWQQIFITDVMGADPDPSHVHWWYDTVGDIGKSFMVDYLVAFHGGICFTNGMMADIAHAYTCQPLVIFDLVHTQEEGLDAVYMAVESFKNSLSIFSLADDSHCVPHVVVFANFAPDKSKLSANRWKICNIITLSGLEGGA